MRAQYIYQLPIIELARGKIQHRNTEARLSVDDCFFIATNGNYGPNLIEINNVKVNFAIAIEWAEAALQ